MIPSMYTFLSLLFKYCKKFKISFQKIHLLINLHICYGDIIQREFGRVSQRINRVSQRLCTEYYLFINNLLSYKNKHVYNTAIQTYRIHGLCIVYYRPN